MVSVDQAYMVGHMKNADGSINNKNVVLSAACEAAELFQCMMSVNQKLEDWQRFNHTLEMHLRSVECEKIHDICQAVYGMKHARNKNIVVIGGSGSGKTRFFVKPSVMQMNCSMVITDPKGTLIEECGKMLAKGPPKKDKNGNIMKDKSGKVVHIIC